jgi:hypothetical protein
MCALHSAVDCRLTVEPLPSDRDRRRLDEQPTECEEERHKQAVECLRDDEVRQSGDVDLLHEGEEEHHEVADQDEAEELRAAVLQAGQPVERQQEAEQTEEQVRQLDDRHHGRV